MQDHTHLIGKLGGGTIVAAWVSKRTGEPIDRERVYKWQSNGVAWKFRGAVAEMAKIENVPLPQNFLGAEASTAVQHDGA